MPVLGSFGPIVFLPIASPEKIQIQEKFCFAQLDVITAPPTLQWIYDDLLHVEVAILLHMRWCAPLYSIQLFTSLAQAHQPQPLSFGQQYCGNYVITELQEDDIWRADDGTIIAARLTLALLLAASTLPLTAPAAAAPQNLIGTAPPQPGATPLLANPRAAAAPPALNFTAAPLTLITRMP